jgi:hypothetical protein
MLVTISGNDLQVTTYVLKESIQKAKKGNFNRGKIRLKNLLEDRTVKQS